LVRRKKLVKTSGTPGRTRQINFFTVNDSLMLVDLPGYGYAKVPPAVRRRWKPMVETYLTSRTVLRGLVLILDLRRDPGPEELDFLRWLQAGAIPVVTVLTKADKLSKTGRLPRRQAVAKALGAAPDRLLLFSAKTGMGRDALWAALEERLGT
jgi:GTP-binding protein